MSLGFQFLSQYMGYMKIVYRKGSENESDGNTERCHRTIEQMLRAFVHTNHFNWLSSLSLAEFAYNNNVHSSIGHSPFVANYGFDPRTPLNLIDPPIDL